MLRFITILLLSLVLHFLLWLGVDTFSNNIEKAKTKDIDIELISNVPQVEKDKNSFEKPVLDTKDNHKPDAKLMQDPASFLAEQNHRYKKETQVEKKGLLKNRLNQLTTNTSKLNFKKDTKQNTKNPNELNSDFKNEVKNQIQNPNDLEFTKYVKNNNFNSNQIRIEDSTSPYSTLKDINIGDVTNLNADAHIFATFYSRVLEMFYIRWSERLDQIWARLSLETKKSLSGKNWTTDVLIVLDETGLYQAAEVLSPSGFKPFDEAGILAFKTSRFFPNPPKEKIEADKKIRLRYRMSVQIR